MRIEISYLAYDGFASKMPFMQRLDPSFIINFMPLLKPIFIKNGEYLYQLNTHPDEIFCIVKGRINLVLEVYQLVYKSYLRKSYIGEIEILLECKRIDTAVAFGSCELLTINKANFNIIMEEFPNEK